MTWPSVDHETHPWQSQQAHGMASRSALRRHQGPYRAVVVPPIAEQRVELPADTLTASTDAAQEVARFDAELGGEIAPFAAILLRTESAASSQIENLTASARAVAEATLGEPTSINARQVAGNVAAMQAAIASADDVDAEAVRGMHHALLQHTDPDIAGQWRSQQVWVGGSSLGPHTAAFVPPHHTHVQPAIEDLVAFIRRSDVPVLAHAALAHAQFETIHPFADGNGRTGRALVHSMLRHSGLVRGATVPISAGLLTAVDRYFEALTSYREGDPGPIVDRFTEASYAAVSNGRRLVRDLREVRAGWSGRVQARRDAATWRVADLLLRHPVVNVGLVATELDIGTQNVYRTLSPLIDAEVLVTSGRQRDRVWRAPEVLAAVDAFARRADCRGARRRRRAAG